MQWFIEKFAVVKATVATQISSPEFYTQIGIIVVALIVGWALAVYVVKSVRVFREEPKPGVLYDLRLSLHNAGELVQPVFAVKTGKRHRVLNRTVSLDAIHIVHWV